MSGKFTKEETINALKAIFEKHKNERVCVVGTMCCGKTTLLSQIPGCVDLDHDLWPRLTEEEAAAINIMPWTREINDEISRLADEKVKIKPGFPVFGFIILDCDAVVYIDIPDSLLLEHCKKRGVRFIDALNVKKAIEDHWNRHKEKNDKVFYYLTVTE